MPSTILMKCADKSTHCSNPCKKRQKSLSISILFIYLRTNLLLCCTYEILLLNSGGTEKVVCSWHPGEMLSNYQGRAEAESSKGERAAFWKKRNLGQTSDVKYTVKIQIFNTDASSFLGKRTYSTSACQAA